MCDCLKENLRGKKKNIKRKWNIKRKFEKKI